MTTDSNRVTHRLARIAGAGALALAAWLSVIVALSFAAPAGDALAIIGPPDRALHAIAAAEGDVVSQGRYVTIARSTSPGFVRRLYAAGALLVLDADQVGGCLGTQRLTQL